MRTKQRSGLRGADAVAVEARALVGRVGERRATEILGVAPATLARLLGGMTVLPSTLLVAAQRLHIPPLGEDDQ